MGVRSGLDDGIVRVGLDLTTSSRRNSNSKTSLPLRISNPHRYSTAAASLFTFLPSFQLSSHSASFSLLVIIVSLSLSVSPYAETRSRALPPFVRTPRMRDLLFGSYPSWRTHTSPHLPPTISLGLDSLYTFGLAHSPRSNVYTMGGNVDNVITMLFGI